MPQAKNHLTASTQAKNGSLYAVIQYKDDNGKRKNKWKSLGLKEGASKAKINAAMREAVESKPAPRPAPRRRAEPAVAARPELSCAWTVEIPSATRSQMELLAAALRERGITGTIRCKGVC